VTAAGPREIKSALLMEPWSGEFCGLRLGDLGDLREEEEEEDA